MWNCWALWTLVYLYLWDCAEIFVELWSITVQSGIALRSLLSCVDLRFLWHNSVVPSVGSLLSCVDLRSLWHSSVVPSVGSRHAVSCPRFLSIVWHAPLLLLTNITTQDFFSLQFYHNLNILEIKFNCLVSREVWLENYHFCKTLSAFLNLPTCNKIVSGYSRFSGQQFGHIINRPMYIVDILQPQLLCTEEGSIFRNVSGASIMTLFCNL